MDDCIFCKIIRKEISSKTIYEDSDSLAFLDINPASPGHVLVVSKKHHANIFSIDDNDLEKLAVCTKKVANIIKEKLGVENINILQNNGKHAGQLVSHMHFHVIPRYPNDGIMISFPRAQTAEKDLDDMKKKLTESVKKDWDLEW